MPIVPTTPISLPTLPRTLFRIPMDPIHFEKVLFIGPHGTAGGSSGHACSSPAAPSGWRFDVYEDV